MLIKIQELKAVILFITLLSFILINLSCGASMPPQINDTPPPKKRKPTTMERERQSPFNEESERGIQRETISTVILDNDFEVVKYINPADQSLNYIIKISSQKKAGEMVRLLEINSIELQSNGNKIILQLDDLFRY